MHSSFTLLSALAVGAVAWGRGPQSGTNVNTDGFENFRVFDSKGGLATCVQGNVPVTASTARGFVLDYPLPANQSVVTGTFVDFITEGSTIAEQVVGPVKTISGTYSINARICYPKSKNNQPGTKIQLLTHGVGFDKSYWDVAAGYSYVDAAAANGSTTFLYDRLGTGRSDHPDPINIVQTPFELAILHELVQKLRGGTFAGTKFANVTGVGHSFGSILTTGITSQYPEDFDAAILTGFSTNSTGQPSFFAALNWAIANENSPRRFGQLNNGYLVADSIISNQFAFFRFPNYDPNLLEIAEATKQTFTIGELFTQNSVLRPAQAYTGLVDIVTGNNDLPFCDGDCMVPADKLAIALRALFPVASKASTTYIAPGGGHGLNLHYVAHQAYEQIQSFLGANGLL